MAGATWAPGKTSRHGGVLSIEVDGLRGAASPMPVGIPAEMGGNAGDATPEHLLAASLASCYGLTLQILLERRRHPALIDRIESCVELKIVNGAIPSIGSLKVRVFLRGEGSSEKEVMALLLRAKQGCLVSKAVSLAHPVRVYLADGVSGELEVETEDNQRR